MNTTFVTYEYALSVIASHKSRFSIVSRDLEDCVGSYLAEDLVADCDFPPFDRVTMDGIAIDYTSFKNGQRVFSIETIAAAGSPQQILKNSLHCIEVMTGAIMPKNVDTVIRYEDITIKGKQATINLDTLKQKQNVHFKGSDTTQGSVLVTKGIQLSSAEINIAAAIGKASLLVKQLPSVAIFSTGDELVDVHKTPELHQIRKSNVYGIQASLKEWGIVSYLYHLNDNEEEMHNEISKALHNYDIFIFTGGVSKGKFDYLPSVLEKLKVKKHFHKIQQRPGKPFWFGSNINGKKVFALPGNPVSSFVCLYIYFKFWLQKSLDLPSKPLYVKLKTNTIFKPDLVYFLEAKLESLEDGSLVATPFKGNGSGDFTSLVKTDGFLILPQGKTNFLKDEIYPFVLYRNLN